MSHPTVIIKYMFDMKSCSTTGGTAPDGGALTSGPDQVPLERLEAQICELAGPLAAATCRFLVLLADFDAMSRRQSANSARLNRTFEVKVQLRFRK